MKLHALGVTKSYGSKPVLENVSLTIERGETVALIGPNGSGKSTFLRILSGLLQADSGSVVVQNGESSRALSNLSRREAVEEIAFLPQSGSYAFSMDVESFVALGFHTQLSRFGRIGAEQKTELDAALRVFEISELRNRSISQLSGGELQRARLARIAISKAPFLLLDEPTSALDPKYVQTTMRFVQSLKEGGRSVISSIHDLSLVTEFDRYLLLSSEGVAATGDSRDLDPAEVGRVYDVATTVLEEEGERRRAWLFG